MWLLRFSCVCAVLYVAIKTPERFIDRMAALPTPVGDGWATVVVEGCSPCRSRWMQNHWGYFRRTQEHQLSQDSRSWISNFGEKVPFEGLHSQGLREFRATNLFGLADQEVTFSGQLENGGCDFGSLQVASLSLVLFVFVLYCPVSESYVHPLGKESIPWDQLIPLKKQL